MPIHDDATIARFWAKVDIRGPDECWPWTGSKNENGYGTMFISVEYGRPERAHRVSWEIKNDRSASGLDICHSCDNPPCANPEHLFSGTALDNITDCIRKGRHSAPPVRFGIANNQTKLTEDDVREIRRRLGAGEAGVAIARFFNIDKSNVSYIKLKKSWGWLT